ncbi:MAG: HAD-IA family hydrolase [Synechococcaceae cyanobacterium]|nr:HAD-IA family hydrolase [Synechococcaceae cyanobacterium]
MTADRPAPCLNWMRPRGLLLDAMGTLIGLRRSVGHTYAAAAAEHGLQVRAAAIDRVFPQVLRQAPPLAFAHRCAADLETAERRWWAERIAAALQLAGAEAMPAALGQDLFERFADTALWQVYPDVAPQLQAWHAAGLKLAVVSNFDGRLQGLLEGLGLMRWLGPVVVSSRAGAAKPSPRPFLLALEALELGPEEAWHIGDSPEDAEGAAAAGLRCLLVRRP